MPAEEVDPTFEALLDYVRDNRGFDFTGYKRASLTRRVRKRMHEVGISSFDEYHDFLEVHPEEFTHLFNTILINVTSFFRDQSAWDMLAQQVIPAIVEQNDGRQHIRVWSRRLRVGRGGVLRRDAPGGGAGQSDGSSTGSRSTRPTSTRTRSRRPRAGIFSAKAVEAIPPELREKYLEPSENEQLRVQQGRASSGDLRSTRPREGRTDLSRRSASCAATRSCTSTRRCSRASTRASGSR